MQCQYGEERAPRLTSAETSLGSSFLVFSSQARAVTEGCSVDELLLQVYFVYEKKSPKKCRKLQEIVDELKACLDPSELPLQGGNRPLRACGTRFVT